VAFFDARGAYAETVVISAARAIPVPAALDDQQAAALPLQGMTARYLTQEIRPLGAGDTVLIHAAAGGVGHIAVQLAKLAGAVVLATCSTEQKASRVRDLGADHVIRYDTVDFADEVLRITGGRGVDVAIDGVGKSTFLHTVRATRVRGHVIFFGQSSGAPDPIHPRRLLGSRTLTTASLFDYARTREEMLGLAGPLLDAAVAGSIRAWIDRVLPLEEADRAHALIEGRRTMGKLLLEP
jgi:NADPH2:quinone reductase